MADPGYVLMTDKTEEQGPPKGPPEVHSDGASRALSAALKKTFESLLEEPVPEKFQELIARIREEEARKTDGEDKDGD